MNLIEKVKKQNTTETATRFTDKYGQTWARIPASPDGLTAELEILRGDLAEILYHASEDVGVKWKFGTEISSLNESSTGVEVEFKSGEKSRWDYVIVAEGATSRTRKLVEGIKAEYKPIYLCKCITAPIHGCRMSLIFAR